MEKNTNSIIGNTISFACFLLSSEFIFSPLHNSGNIIISTITAFITGFLCLTFISKLFMHKRSDNLKEKSFSQVIAIVLASFSVIISLMLLTEIIKDVAYVANRNISLFYYLSLSFAILAVSYYLCYNSEKGIFRFTIISSTVFIFIFITVFSAFITTKSIILDKESFELSAVSGSFLTGILTGLFLTADSTAYLFCFDSFIRSKNDSLNKKSLIYGFITAFTIIAVYNSVTVLIFGTKLTTNISDPDYALVKLLPGIDFTEIISALRIISFMIKSSIYIYSSSKLLQTSFGRESSNIAPFIFIQYMLIPITVTALTLFDKSLEYGAFQHLIYPIVILYSLMTAISRFLYQKKE